MKELNQHELEQVAGGGALDFVKKYGLLIRPNGVVYVEGKWVVPHFFMKI